tara:strand:+ start:1297 stop:2271 length:975 start_codon:yes stop_codon:yes gene_type:complete
MKKNNINVCQVSLFNNLDIIKLNYFQFKKFYNDINFYLICPEESLSKFEDHTKNFQIKLINENNVINFEEFKIIANSYLCKTNYFDKIQSRLKWYYQQVLKITYLIDFVENKNENLIIWDADTLILKKINFFNENSSNVFGITSEYFKAYYQTNKTILGTLPKYFISSLCQFTTLNNYECKTLVNQLNKYKKRENKTAEWITSIIFSSILNTHKDYNGSMFSEYELIGHSKLIDNFQKQKLISGVREGLNGKLTINQEKIVKLLNYQYVAYEEANSNENIKDILTREQSWLKFFILIIKKTTNKIFRGIKFYLILNYLKFVKWV